MRQTVGCSRATVLVATALAVALGWGRLSDAQTVPGTVRDALSKAPIAGATVSILDTRDSVRRAVITDNAGTFSVTASAPGTYALSARRLGFKPITTTAAELGRGDTVTITLELAPTPVALDTVVTRSDTQYGLFHVTPGHEMVARHFALGKGIIVSGMQIEQSGLLLSEYLGRLKGLILTSTIGQPTPLPGNPYKGSITPVVPAAHGKFLISEYGQRCLYARIDHWSIFGRMMSVTGGPTDIDLLATVKDIMAVEIYKNRADIPVEWQQDAWPDRMIYVRTNGGYYMGDVGIPKVELDSLEVKQGLGAVNAFTFVDSLMPNGTIVPSTDAPREGGGLSHRLQADMKGPSHMRIVVKPAAFLSADIALGVDLGPQGISGGVPTCGFIQIWTKASW